MQRDLSQGMLWGWVVCAGEIQLCCSMAPPGRAREGMGLSAWSLSGVCTTLQTLFSSEIVKIRAKMVLLCVFVGMQHLIL